MFRVIVLYIALLGVYSPMADGEDAIKSEQWNVAIRHYKEALDTLRLNSFGMAVAYWGIFVAKENLGIRDSENLLMFIISANTALQEEETGQIKAFMLRYKLLYASALIQARWAARNGYSCRSPDFSCAVDSESMINIFVENIPFCGDVRNMLYLKSSMEYNLYRVNVRCLNNNEVYYFNIRD